MSKIINLGLRGLQVSRRPGRHLADSSLTNGCSVLMDISHIGAGRQHDRRRRRWQPIDRQLLHVRRSLLDTLAHLPRCGDGQ